MRQLQCAEIWGGIKNQDQDLCSGGLTISLYSSASDGGKGGDIYYFSVCPRDTLTRIAVADVVGHGQAVSDVSQWMYTSLQTRMNKLDGHEILDELNRLAVDRGYNAVTTATVVGYYTVKSTLYFCYAGHHPVLIRRRGESGWQPAKAGGSGGGYANLPLGVDIDVAYRQEQVAIGSGDRLFIYTDGVIEAPDQKRRLFGQERLLSILEDTSGGSPMEIKGAVLSALREHTGGTLGHDDVTLIVVEVR